MTPPSGRTVIKRLAHLPAARGRDGPSRAVKLEARRLPFEPEGIDQPSAFAFEIGDQRFVFDLVHAQRQHSAPVRCDALGFKISSRAIRQSGRKRQVRSRQLLKIARKANVTRIAPAEYHTPAAGNSIAITPSSKMLSGSLSITRR